MAVTEVELDFTYSYNSILGLSVGGQHANVPNIDGEASVLQLQMDSGFQSGYTGSLSKGAVEVSMEGSLVVRGSGSGSAQVLEIKASGTMFTTQKIEGEASVVEVTMEGSGFVSSNLSMDKEVILLSMEGQLLTNWNPDLGDSGGPIIIPADDDGEYPNISGEEYIVVNLRTKAHSTYRDGERTAVAKTGSMDFGTYSTKTVTDMFMLSRAKGDMEVLVNTKEDVERRYPLSHGSTQQANMKNKKLPLGKGLKGVNWALSVVVPDESHLEIRGIELLVTDLKRRT